ncbi:hypothetical protein SESBI_49143 [Sesbania bispinosa]|nr:hypothetical protein SESBI_49143 [Sesbania bispinosa]
MTTQRRWWCDGTTKKICDCAEKERKGRRRRRYVTLCRATSMKKMDCNDNGETQLRHNVVQSERRNSGKNLH